MTSLGRRKRGRPEKETKAPTSSAAKLSLREKYLHFHELISAHQSVLEAMAGLEAWQESDELFSFKDLRGKIEAIIRDCRRMAESLNIMSSGRYPDLGPAVERIEAGLNKALGPLRPPLNPELVFDFSELMHCDANLVGAKMANLAEVRNCLGLPAPDGFVMAFSAAKLFFENAGLPEKINQILFNLDVSNLSQVQRASREVQGLINQAEAAPTLAEALHSGYENLCRRLGRRLRVAMRSSALGEDSTGLSFAGIYRSVFNLSQEELLASYKEILASVYSPQALLYQAAHGLRHDEVLMAVGCLAMIDARSAGVATTIDPQGQFNEAVVVSSVWGLGRLAVDGSLIPDILVISNRDGRLIHQEISHKRAKYVCLESEGFRRLEDLGSQAQKASISEAEARQVAGAAVRFAEYFNGPQEVEWAIDQAGQLFFLQARPLILSRDTGALEKAALISALPEAEEIEAEALLSGGVRVQAGVAAGPVFIVRTDADAASFPDGAILVATAPEPRLAAVLNKAKAVVTDMGGMLGHLATVCREYGRPAIFGAGVATKLLAQGEMVTVDAWRGRVFRGRVEALLASQPTPRQNRPRTAVHQTLSRAMIWITPFYLLDPASADFSPQNARTIHDLCRYCHEKALFEMFFLGDMGVGRDPGVKRLITKVPLLLWLIDLGDGLVPEAEKLKEISLDHVVSKPMRAFWQGATHPGVHWAGPVNLNLSGFMTVVMQSAAGLHENSRPLGQNSYFVVGQNYFTFNSRLAYHFAAIGSYLCAEPNYNYIHFSLQGGAASIKRRELRAMFLAQILSDMDFTVVQRGDLVEARLERRDEAATAEKLEMVGRLMGCARQLDMVMSDEEAVRRHVRAFFEGDYTFRFVKEA